MHTSDNQSLTPPTSSKGSSHKYPTLREIIAADFRAEGIQTLFSSKSVKSFFFSPTIRLLFWFRIGSYMKGKKLWFLLYPIVFLFYRHLRYLTGIQIPLGMTIGRGLRLIHFGDVVFNASAKLGNNCVVFNGVTIGASQRGGLAPKVGNNVIICTGAKLIGNITVGNNAIIGAGAVVVKDIPDNAVVGGVPAKILSMDGEKKCKNWSII